MSITAESTFTSEAVESEDQHALANGSTDNTNYGWERNVGIPIHVVAIFDPESPGLILRCQCKSKRKQLLTESCGFHKDHLSRTS